MTLLLKPNKHDLDVWDLASAWTYRDISRFTVWAVLHNDALHGNCLDIDAGDELHRRNEQPRPDTIPIVIITKARYDELVAKETQ